MNLLRLHQPLFVVKVHAQGIAWWREQNMPPTRTIGCRTLDQRPNWRTYAQPRMGLHYIYEAAPGLTWPSVEFDTFIDMRGLWTRMPPDPTKFWVDDREPTVIDWLPDPSPLRELALDLGPNKREQPSRSG